MFEWIKSLFNLEERKASTIMLAFIAFVIIAIAMFINKGDIPDNLSNLIFVLGGYIAGYNVMPYITKSNKEFKDTNNGLA